MLTAILQLNKVFGRPSPVAKFWADTTLSGREIGHFHFLTLKLFYKPVRFSPNWATYVL
jgi:hypothetical protein